MSALTACACDQAGMISRILSLQTFHSPGRLVDGTDVLLKANLLAWLIEVLLTDPGEMPLPPPSLAGVAPTMTEQKGSESLACSALRVLGVFPSSGEITHRLRLRIWHPHGCQFAGS